MNPIERAELALEGLSIGDSFGQMFFGKEQTMLAMIDQRALPAPPWHLTDDSIMAIGVVETLKAKGQIDQDYLVQRFAANYQRNPQRGYGGMAHYILRALCQGKSWQEVSPSVFDGFGSYGNGAAMRIAPLGAYFADDLRLLCAQATLSAEVTHSHPEGQAGAVAVAAAAAWAWNNRQSTHPDDGLAMLDFVLSVTPDGDTKSGIAKARNLPFSYRVETAVAALGNGTRVSSQDTVPFALWCAARHCNDFEAALWTTVSGLGDRDTTCAIVGGILALKLGYQAIPDEWKRSREPLFNWP